MSPLMLPGLSELPSVATIEQTSTVVRRPLRALTPPCSSIQGLAEGIGDLADEMQADGVPVVDPLERHARDVGTKDLLGQAVHDRPHRTVLQPVRRRGRL